MEMTKKDLYNNCIDMGYTHDKAIDTIIDFFTNGISASWSNDTLNKARETVEINLLKS